MKTSNYIFILLLILNLGCTSNKADLIVINSKIYTANKSNEVAKSIAVRNGKIIDIDSINLDNKYEAKVILDANEKTILPGLIDSHCHFYNLGLDQQVVDLRGTTSFEEIIERLKVYDLNNESNVILGRGWDQNDWETKQFPVNTQLNSIFKNKLVVLERIDGHAYIVNDNTLQLAGIDENTLIRGGLVLLKNNKPTGVLIDAPMSMVDKVLPEKTTKEKAVNKIKVIDREKIEAIGAVNLRDVLSNENNIRISQDNVLGSFTSLQGISGQNVKILIDGVPIIGRLNGSVDLSQINLNDIERIEIVEGPLSVNYGTDALAGTINLISKKKTSDGFSVNLNSYYESIGQYNFDGTISYKQNNNQFNFSAGRNFFDGWSKNEQFSILPKKLLADESRFKEWKPKEQIFYNGKYRYRTSYFEFNTSYSGFYEQIVNRGIPREPLFINSFDDYYRTWRKTLLANAKYQFKKSEWNISLSHSAYNRIKNTYFIDLTNLEKNISSNISDQDTSKFRNSIIKSIFKLPAKKNLDSEVGIDLNFESAEGRRINSKNQSIADFAIFTNLEWLYRQNLVFRPGLRYAHNTNYDPPLIPSLHLKYSFGLFILRSSFAKGFRSPSLKEQYFNFVDINHNIIGHNQLPPQNSARIHVENYNII